MERSQLLVKLCILQKTFGHTLPFDVDLLTVEQLQWVYESCLLKEKVRANDARDDVFRELIVLTVNAMNKDTATTDPAFTKFLNHDCCPKEL